MRPLGIVPMPPPVHNISRVGKAQKQLAVQTFIPQPAIKRFNIAILPWTTRGYKQSRNAFIPQHLYNQSRPELATVIAPNRNWLAVFCK
jgi:hypothetical protein